MLMMVLYHNAAFIQTEVVVNNPEKLEHPWELVPPAFKAWSTSTAAEHL